MQKLKCILVLILLFCSSLIFSQDENFNEKMIQLRDDKTISNDSLFTILSNWNEYQELDSTGVFIQFNNQINDTLQAPYIVYIPSDYQCQNKTPLLVYLHGGVSRQQFIEGYIEYIQDNTFKQFADEVNWIMLFPMGNIDTTWWDLNGIRNIKQQIRILKAKYNIDDNRIWITGFSDGGSASFHFALNDPNDFACLYPLNGYVSVGSRVTNTPVFLPNLMNRPVYVVNTDLDRLYPSAKMKPLMELSLEAGANLLYKEYYGIGHEFTYADEEIPIMIENMKNHIRDIFRPKIYWESWSPDFNKCDWIEIVSLDTTETQKEWQKQYQATMADDRIQFGFFHDNEYQDQGIKVNNLIDGESTAKEMGLMAGDVVIKMDGVETNDINDMDSLKTFKLRGDHVSLTVKREGDIIELFGQFPDTTYYDAFLYNKPSGAITVTYCGNQFDIETSRVREFAIYLHPDMVNFKNPVSVTINGKEVFNDIVNIDRDFLITNFQNNRDRSALWTKRLVFEVGSI